MVNEELKLLPTNGEDDWEFIRQLRTDPKNVDGFVQQTPITKEQQKKYMLNHVNDYWIGWLNGVRVGFIGVVDEDIRVCVDDAYKGKGIGKWMVNNLDKVYNKNKSAKVKVKNIASQKLFESCGYKLKYYIYEKE